MIRTTTSGKIAAFMAEPIQGVGGFITPPPSTSSIVAEIARHYGGLFICDEVQTGFGRTGKHWFGISHWDVEPDIMTMAKGIANGLPMGNTIARPEVADSMVGKGLTISTFGGNPVSTAASLATIETHRGGSAAGAHRRDRRRTAARRAGETGGEVPADRRRARQGADAGHRDGDWTARPRSRRPRPWRTL